MLLYRLLVFCFFGPISKALWIRVVKYGLREQANEKAKRWTAEQDWYASSTSIVQLKVTNKIKVGSFTTLKFWCAFR
jgi:hypothetical protein